MKTPDRRPFRFKQFDLYQDRCAMKIGTDGALLGAWADVSGVERALDIGTGTGLIVMMLCQRAEELKVDAVELDADAASQAAENIAKSKFSDRIAVHHSPVQRWTPQEGYDLIVSNPPFFSSNLRSPNHKRSQARHDDELPLGELVFNVARLLKPSGRFVVIWPTDREAELTASFETKGMFLYRRCAVHPTPQKDCHRVLNEYRRMDDRPEINETVLVIEQSGRGVYSEQFIELLRDFHLDF